MGQEFSAQLKEAGIEAGLKEAGIEFSTGPKAHPHQNAEKHEGDSDVKRTAGVPCVVCGEDALLIRDTCRR